MAKDKGKGKDKGPKGKKGAGKAPKGEKVKKVKQPKVKVKGRLLERVTNLVLLMFLASLVARQLTA